MMKPTKTSSTGPLWGELPARELHKQEVITPDIIENIWRTVLEDSDNPGGDYGDKNDIAMPMGNVHVLNTINYHQQLRSMEDGTVLKDVTSMEEDCKPAEPQNPFRFLTPRPRRTFKNTFKKNYPTTELKSETARSLLKHSVMVLLAHIGYEKSSDVAVETITDVADFFLLRISRLLKLASEQDDYGFPDAVERVLLESGVGGVEELHNYYQNTILRFEQRVRKKVEKAVEKQKLELDACNSKMELDEIASRFQFQEFDRFGNVYEREVPTLQLLDPDMGFPPSLDAGFQMLHSLEQDESIK
ncbi:STAGA complex 65 subunit gamma-like isoform X2 [Belonocnema kinseyi]|uniref:STAGA complex 65 subunit gamma-like isoform X2 n=1 Tax=Belonocnema kinseyi TaxID=2817044 RepID=UPI00143E04FF|nr:STAGA complex 65 subunit gamma-like isoform X2 [Belonocnema kinseyi]